MAKKVWILNHHANNMYFANGGRHYCIAKYLKRKGYEPFIVCANAEHGTGKKCFDNEDLFSVHINTQIDVPFIFVKSRTYTNNGKDRIMGMFDYYFNVKKIAKEIVERYGKPDVIIGSSVHLLACLAGIKLSKKYGAKCITEIRDLWPESIVAYGLATKKNVIIKILYKFEKYLYEHSDDIIFTMPGGKNYIIEQGWNRENGGKIDLARVHNINNGTDLEVFTYNREKYQLDDNDLNNNEIFKVVYTGSLRKANEIDLLVETAKITKESTIKFLIWGRGDEEEYLKKLVQKYGLNNIIFKGSVEKKYIPYIISKSNVNFLDAFDERVAKYGISSNKLFEYFAAQKPILISEMDIYPMKGSGFLIPYKKEPNDIYKKIMEIFSMKDNCSDLCDSANEATKIYNYESLTEKMVEVIEG